MRMMLRATRRSSPRRKRSLKQQKRRVGQKAPQPGRERRIRSRYLHTYVLLCCSIAPVNVYLFWILFHSLLDLFLCEWKLSQFATCIDLIMDIHVGFIYGGGCFVNSQTGDWLGSVQGQFLHQFELKAHLDCYPVFSRLLGGWMMEPLKGCTVDSCDIIQTN